MLHLYSKKTLFDRFFQCISILLFFGSITSLAFLISVNQRGFDISDEGFHLLASQFPKEIKLWPNVAHIYTALMFNLAGQNIVILRIMSEVLLFSSASFFAWALFQLLINAYPKASPSPHLKIIAWSTIGLGALFYYVHYDTTPSYNSINATALNTASGFLFLCLANLSLTPTQIKLAIINSYASGAIIGITLLVKFPTAFALTTLFTFMLMVWPQTTWQNRMINISMLILGVGTWLLFHITYLQSWPMLWNTLYLGVSTFLSFGLHNPSFCFQHYLPELIALLSQAVKGFGAIYLFLFTGIIVASFTLQKNRIKALGAFFILLFILASLHSISLGFLKGGATNAISLMETYVSWLLLLLSAVTLTLFHQKKLVSIWQHLPSKRLLIICAFLLILPLAGAVGTANIITLNLTQYMAAWFAIMMILLSILAHFYDNRWIYLSGAFFLTVFASSQIISAGFIAPYGINTSIKYQTIPTALGFPRSYLKLDKATHEFFIKMNQIAQIHGFKPGDDMLAFSDMPGVVFALGGKSPVVPLYTSLPNANVINGSILRLAPLMRIKKAFILQSEHGVESMPDLTKLGIHFPRDYIFCGETIWPYTGEWVRLWKAKV